jgi:hypothetical protein
MNRPKKETPEKRARDEKAYQKGLMLTPEELKQKEAMLAKLKGALETEVKKLDEAEKVKTKK